MTSPLALSPDARLETLRFGNEGQALVQVEGALSDLALVRDIAAHHRYAPIGPFYPGIRAAVSEKIAMPLVAPMMPQICDALELAGLLAYRECYLSLVTKAPGDLDPIQRLPHFDGVEPELVAILLYLSDDSEGGTAFYRQRSTGFETVDAARYDDYREALDADMKAHGMPEAGYIGSDSPMFERTLKVEGKANRLIAYRGNLLHCASMPDGFVPDENPLTGRLTLNLFLKA